MSWQIYSSRASLTSMAMSSMIINSITIRFTTTPRSMKCLMSMPWPIWKKSTKTSGKESIKKMYIIIFSLMTVKTPPSKLPSIKTFTTSTSSSFPTTKGNCLPTLSKTHGPKEKIFSLSRKEQSWNWSYFMRTGFLQMLSTKVKWA